PGADASALVGRLLGRQHRHGAGCNYSHGTVLGSCLGGESDPATILLAFMPLTGPLREVYACVCVVLTYTSCSILDAIIAYTLVRGRISQGHQHASRTIVPMLQVPFVPHVLPTSPTTRVAQWLTLTALTVLVLWVAIVRRKARAARHHVRAIAPAPVDP
ncbi:unnamed protein product, partial [Pylaiella littoralis]